MRIAPHRRESWQPQQIHRASLLRTKFLPRAKDSAGQATRVDSDGVLAGQIYHTVTTQAELRRDWHCRLCCRAARSLFRGRQTRADDGLQALSFRKLRPQPSRCIKRGSFVASQGLCMAGADVLKPASRCRPTHRHITFRCDNPVSYLTIGRNTKEQAIPSVARPPNTTTSTMHSAVRIFGRKAVSVTRRRAPAAQVNYRL